MQMQNVKLYMRHLSSIAKVVCSLSFAQLPWFCGCAALRALLQPVPVLTEFAHFRSQVPEAGARPGANHQAAPRRHVPRDPGRAGLLAVTSQFCNDVILLT